MEAGITPEQRATVIEAMDSDPDLARMIHGLVDAVQRRELAAKSHGALEQASEALPEPKIGPKITIEQMEAELRAAGGPYNDEKIWNQVGAKTVPAIPDTVIQEAYEKGGAMGTSRELKVAILALVEAAQNGELSTKSAGALEKVSDILPESKITATPTGTFVELPDDREGFAPHHAYLFSVAPSKGTVLDELKTLLGEAAANQLVEDWGGRCDLNQTLPATQVALFLDSNNKARNRDYADRGDKTTQEEDFKATGHQFAGDLAATLLCARIVKKVQDGERLSEGEQDLYQKLKDGVLRSCSGALGINVSGRLRANYFCAFRLSSYWALGSPLSPELK